MAEIYQWTEGPYKGKTEILNCETETSVFFNSGRSCNKEELNYKMVQLPDQEDFDHTMNQNGFMGFDEEMFNPSNDYGIEDDAFLSTLNVNSIDDNGNVQVDHSNTPQTNAQTQNDVTPFTSHNEKKNEQPKKPNTTNETIKTNVKSPIRNLLDLQKEDSLENRVLTLNIPLKYPSDSIIKLLHNTFDCDDVKNEIVNYLNDQINKDKLISEIKDSILSQINEIIN